YRVAATPNAVTELCRRGHKVLVETKAGTGSGYSDEEYRKAGASITDSESVFRNADLIYKVKEVFPEEIDKLREGQILMTYIHSNAHPEMTRALLDKKVIGVAYEDVADEQGGFPLLRNQSEIAGKGGFLAALNFSQSIHGGPGLMLSRVCGTETPKITIIGCGWSGMGAAELAASFGNRVTMLDIDRDLMIKAQSQLPSNIQFLYSNRTNLLKCLAETDVLINCILWSKTRKDHLIYRDDLKIMKPGALIIDVACDDNGAIETSRSTSHDDPVYYENEILHYCVDNIPSAYAKTASVLLSETTLPYVTEIADKGFEKALKDNKGLRRGLTFYFGKLTLEETAIKQGIEYVSPDRIVDQYA
ncbi:MAG TPA: alanine dehydrogenase, partial [Anaerovoracaceae bacterium]|nr:alanine dehydrogenase [Anaerovoracaceae bacterium]